MSTRSRGAEGSRGAKSKYVQKNPNGGREPSSPPRGSFHPFAPESVLSRGRHTPFTILGEFWDLSPDNGHRNNDTSSDQGHLCQRGSKYPHALPHVDTPPASRRGAPCEPQPFPAESKATRLYLLYPSPFSPSAREELRSLCCIPQTPRKALTGPLSGIGPRHLLGPGHSTERQLVGGAWREVQEGVIGDPASDHRGQVGATQEVREHEAEPGSPLGAVPGGL